jgi:acylglycerol lipase
MSSVWAQQNESPPESIDSPAAEQPGEHGGDQAREQPDLSGLSAGDLYARKLYTQALAKYEAEAQNLKLSEVKLSKESKESNHTFSDEQLIALDNLADCLCQCGKYSRARAIYEQVLAYWNKQPACAVGVKKQLESELAVAGCHFHEHNYQQVEKILPHCIELSRSKELEKAYRTRMVVLMQIYKGETLYRERQYDDAVKVFVAALDQLASDNTTYLSYELNKMVLESLGGCYQHLGQLQKAEPVLRAKAILDKNYYGDDIRYGWSLFLLSDALKANGRKDEARSIYQKAIYIFRMQNRDRLATEYGVNDEQLKAAEAKESPEIVAKKKQMAETLTQAIFGSPESAARNDGDKSLLEEAKNSSLFDHCELRKPGEKLGAWNLHGNNQKEAPGWVWVDPRVERKAILMCVHGLGLHHRAYESFARRIAREGITIVSLDVRGFGSFYETKGSDSLDMKACVNDLVNVLRELRIDYKGLPMFLLGESMGGALVLRVAADHPELVDGIVCSVPAGQRHKETGTKLKVALNLFSNANKDLDIGKGVVNRSTLVTSERDRWSNDPQSRLRLSAKELFNFETFMRHNAEFARRITKTPVIVFQGNLDRLVKREGTYDLFEAVGTDDKTLVLLGDREHLIFEANPFKDDITLGIVGWLDAHSKKAPQAATSLSSVSFEKDEKAKTEQK